MDRNILIVEDEARIREIVTDFFRANDFGVHEASTGIELKEANEKLQDDIEIERIQEKKRIYCQYFA